MQTQKNTNKYTHTQIQTHTQSARDVHSKK